VAGRAARRHVPHAAGRRPAARGRTGQGKAAGLRLGALLQRSERLLQAPLRHAFPGLLAAATGELVMLDTLEQAGEPALAESLRAHGVAQALGVPIPADGPGAPRGALSLLLDASAALAPEALDTLGDSPPWPRWACACST
jgi:hypothetical protein